GYDAYQLNAPPLFPRAPRPFFEGDLDRSMLTPSSAARGWTASRVPGRDGELVIAAGVLHGLAEGMEIALKTPAQHEPVARGQIVEVGVASSRIKLSKPLDSAPSGTPIVAEPVAPHIDLALRVAFAPESAVADPDRSDQLAVRRAVEQMRSSDYR